LSFKNGVDTGKNLPPWPTSRRVATGRLNWILALFLFQVAMFSFIGGSIFVRWMGQEFTDANKHEVGLPP
ncbi:hypothetical protein, partial [Desulfamplus magnetovallimortis]|uniref:hypothetical protein n=1 Tax=Desulfamplus magnetovallimortis TaxID=1246637 RepID=UPI001C96F54B